MIMSGSIYNPSKNANEWEEEDKSEMETNGQPKEERETRGEMGRQTSLNRRDIFPLVPWEDIFDSDTSNPILIPSPLLSLPIPDSVGHSLIPQYEKGRKDRGEALN